MRRSLILLLTLVLLHQLTLQANHLLSPLRLSLFPGGLYVVFAALRLPWRAGLLAIIPAGFLCDAYAPVPFGTHALLFLLAHGAIYNIRDRLARDDSGPLNVLVTLAANFGLFLALSFLHVGGAPSPAAAWGRLLVDLIASQVVLALVAPWFFALQFRALVHARAEPVPLD